MPLGWQLKHQRGLQRRSSKQSGWYHSFGTEYFLAHTLLWTWLRDLIKMVTFGFLTCDVLLLSWLRVSSFLDWILGATGLVQWVQLCSMTTVEQNWTFVHYTHWWIHLFAYNSVIIVIGAISLNSWLLGFVFPQTSLGREGQTKYIWTTSFLFCDHCNWCNRRARQNIFVLMLVCLRSL